VTTGIHLERQLVVSVMVMPGYVTASTPTNPHGKLDIDILGWANARSEPEAADNRTEGRKDLLLCCRSGLSSGDRTIPNPVAFDGSPYR